MIWEEASPVAEVWVVRGGPSFLSSCGTGVEASTGMISFMNGDADLRKSGGETGLSATGCDYVETSQRG